MKFMSKEKSIRVLGMPFGKKVSDFKKEIAHMSFAMNSSDDLGDQLGRAKDNEIFMPFLLVPQRHGSQDKYSVNRSVFQERVYPFEGVRAVIVMNPKETYFFGAIVLGNFSSGFQGSAFLQHIIKGGDSLAPDIADNS